MDSMKKKKLIDNSLTYGLVIACWVVVQIMMATGHMTSLMKGLLVPLCMYVILAVSLNLTVGILGELSLGHAGFMCVGAFSGAFFTKLTAEAIPNLQVRFILALIIGALVAALFGILIGIPVLRLRGDYLAIVTLAFGEIIKNARMKADITVEDLATKVGVTERFIYRIENEGKKPSYDILYKLIRELSILPDQIFFPEKQIEDSEMESLVRMLYNCDERSMQIIKATVRAALDSQPKE